ncbi:hypothetical protein [Mycolicibacterium canariasense]|uniref:hypothetical protein n=1 Tax=Mycolicibacterium canariasense TaxID=228230 RepID=UPI0032D56763
MGKDTTKASDHPSTNALDKHDDGSVDTGGVYIGLSATNIKLEESLEIGDTGLLMVKYEVTADGRKKMADGELRDRRTLKVISAWKPNGKPVGVDPNQTELYPTDPVTGGPTEEDGTVDTGGGED